MKKKFYLFNRYWTLCLVIMLLGTTNLFGYSGFSEQLKNLKFNNTSLKAAIEQLLDGSNYNIIYTVKDISDRMTVTAELKDVTVEKALTIILNQHNLIYVVEDNNVVISKAVPSTKKQEQKTIQLTGKVIHADTKKPIAGATIIVENSSVGSISDGDGNFMLKVAPESKINVSFLGMVSQIITVKATDKQLIIQLVPDLMEMDEVIVNGYQTTTKSRSTGSVGVITSEQLKDAPLRSMDMLMQGKIAGVNVQAVSGRPGETAKIRIRGTNTLTGNAEPLWIVDGIMLQKDFPAISTSEINSGEFSSLFTNGIAGINPNDIESITVLKDASAAAIYGSRAASGVIVVTTKRGKVGKMSVTYSGTVSVINKPVRDLDLMNSAEKLSWENELWNEFSKDGFEKNGYYPVIGITGMVRSGYGKFKGMSSTEQESYLKSLENNSTNWINELFRTSVSHNHNLSFSGGSEKTTYYVSTGYGKTNGLQKNNSYDHMNLNAKINMKLHDKVTLDFNTSLSYQKSKDASGGVDLYNYAYFANPYETPYNADGSYRSDDTYFELSPANGNLNVIIPDGGINILRDLNETSSRVKSLSITQIVSLNWNIYKDLRFEGIGSFSYTNNNNENINGINSYSAFLDRPFDLSSNSKRKYGSIAQNSGYNSSYSLRGQFAYSKELNEKHYLSVLAGTEINNQYAKSIVAKRYGYDPVTGNSSFPITVNPGTASASEALLAYAKIMDGLSGQSIDESVSASFYFSGDYTYDKRYTISLAGRTDGSNNFGSREQFNPAWSVGGLWNIRNERFMEGKARGITRFTLRGSAGYTGNINKSVYPQFIMDYDAYFRKYGDEIIRMGEIRNAPNPHLRWERTLDYKIGLDMGFFKNRLSFVLEAYERLTSNVVTPVAVPYTTGFMQQSFNTSKIRNRGVELSILATLVSKKDWTLSLSVNGAYNQNILEEYLASSGYINGSNYEGYPLNSIFGGKYIGIDPYTGVYLFEERSDAVFNNKKDYTDSNNYMYYLGTSEAPVSGGYSLNLRYKQFSLGVGGTYSIGGKVLNNIKSPARYDVTGKNTTNGELVPTSRNDLYVNHLNVSKDVINRWREDNKITSGSPRLIDAFAPPKGYETFMTTSSTINNGAFLENVSYFKITSISLSYSLGEKALRKIGIGSLGFSFTMNNLLTISNYTGIDPEVPGAIYPQSRSFSVGVSIGF